ncbi:hypothetical protein C8Q74DRAFT_747269 [Fomes fomentarius]|nr:hypothetical protein C8Q74DRAFT_747269 [Fomes fomentarius]
MYLMPSSIVTPRAVAAHILNGQTSDAQQATVKTLLALAGSNLESDADSEPFVLTPSTVGPREIPASTEAYLERLSRNANAAAASLFCGSILAGHTSEADEYGDVAIALGDGTFGPGHELDVVNALGLGNLAQRDQGPESTSIPSTVNVPAESGAEVQELSLQLQELHERHAFYFEKDHLGVYFLVGRHDEFGWVGLAGVGVQT